MSLTIIPKSKQAPGQFNGGEILEKRPVIAMRTYPHLKPYSNLFYWAMAWSDRGSTIGEHPHQGFEILSFVVKGAIEHYDSAHEGWKKLKEGDAQVIRAGSGISHSEKINAGSKMFQIWFDPDLDAAIQKPASYDDYASEKFPVEDEGGIKTKIYKGKNSPMKLDTEAVTIKELWLKSGTHILSLDKNSIHSVFVIEGMIEVNGQAIEKEDYFRIQDEESVSLNVKENARLFYIQTPAKVSYRTYASMMI